MPYSPSQQRGIAVDLAELEESLADEMRRRGLKSTFRSTGQTGILITGDGVPLDAVIADARSCEADRLERAVGDEEFGLIPDGVEHAIVIDGDEAEALELIQIE